MPDKFVYGPKDCVVNVQYPKLCGGSKKTYKLRILRERILQTKRAQKGIYWTGEGRIREGLPNCHNVDQYRVHEK